MSPALERLLQDALALGASERARLAARLIESLEPEAADADYEAAWTAEIERRRVEIESGAVLGISVEQLFDRLRSRADDEQR